MTVFCVYDCHTYLVLCGYIGPRGGCSMCFLLCGFFPQRFTSGSISRSCHIYLVVGMSDSVLCIYDCHTYLVLCGYIGPRVCCGMGFLLYGFFSQRFTSGSISRSCHIYLVVGMSASVLCIYD